MSVRIKKYDELHVHIYSTRSEMGIKAGEAIEKEMIKTIEEKGEVRVIFASAPSQNEMLNYLKVSKKIDWEKVVAFHMDEYIGISKQAPQSFSKFIEDRLFEGKKLKAWHPMLATDDTEKEMEKYARLLSEKKIDVTILGIGENGHLAFNDPPVADFDDEKIVKVVELEEACRVQQVNDGCFATLKEVPTHALTITIPPLLKAGMMFAIVPGPTKKFAIQKTLQGSIGTSCPASILRNYNNCILFIDDDSYALCEQ